MLRHSVFLHRVALSNGWNSFTLNSLVHSSGVIRLPKYSRSRLDADDAQADSLSGAPTRSDISSSLSLAHGPWILHLGSREKIDVLRFMASLYDSLSYRRKEAYVLRELVSCVMDLFVHGREESRGTSVVSSASLDASGERGDREGEVGIREAHDITGNNSIIEIVKYVCKVHGVDLGCAQFSDDSSQIQALSSSSGRRRKAETLHFGWPELQIGLVREALAIAEGLPGKLLEYLSVLKTYFFFFLSFPFQITLPSCFSRYPL